MDKSLKAKQRKQWKLNNPLKVLISRAMCEPLYKERRRELEQIRYKKKFKHIAKINQKWYVKNKKYISLMNKINQLTGIKPPIENVRDNFQKYLAILRKLRAEQ